MLLQLYNELTTKSLLYDEMLKWCNHKADIELEMHKARMEYLAEEIQKVRDQIYKLTK